jgi:hypothetical protein
MEELKIILEAINGLGADAKIAFIIYMLIKYLAHYIIVGGIFISAFIVAYKLIRPIILYQEFINNIKAIMGFNGLFINAEAKEVLYALKQYKKGK